MRAAGGGEERAGAMGLRGGPEGVTSGQTPSAEQDGQLEQEKEGDAGQPQQQRPGRASICRGGKEREWGGERGLGRSGEQSTPGMGAQGCARGDEQV